MSLVSATEAIETAQLRQASHAIDLARIDLHIAKQNAEKSIRRAPRQLRDCDVKIKAGDQSFVLVKADLMKSIKRCIVAERGIVHSRTLLVMTNQSAYEMLKARIEMARIEGQIRQELDSFVNASW